MLWVFEISGLHKFWELRIDGHRQVANHLDQCWVDIDETENTNVYLRPSNHAGETNSLVTALALYCIRQPHHTDLLQ